MSTILYSTKCYIKNNLFYLSISSDDTKTSEFTPTLLSINSIRSTITKINIESIDNRKHSKYSKIISINSLLSIQQVETVASRNRKEFSGVNRESFDEIEPSRQNNGQTFERKKSDGEKSTTARQFSFSRIFSSQTYLDSQLDLSSKTMIIIKYIDVSNSIRWNIKRLKLCVETEDIANELYMNLNTCLSVLKQRPRNLLAFINPFGGKGK